MKSRGQVVGQAWIFASAGFKVTRQRKGSESSTPADHQIGRCKRSAHTRDPSVYASAKFNSRNNQSRTRITDRRRALSTLILAKLDIPLANFITPPTYTDGKLKLDHVLPKRRRPLRPRIDSQLPGAQTPKRLPEPPTLQKRFMIEKCGSRLRLR